MSEPAAAPAPATISPPATPEAGTEAAGHIGKEAAEAPGAESWVEAAAALDTMQLPQVVEDGGRLGNNRLYEVPAGPETLAPATTPAPIGEGAEGEPEAPAETEAQPAQSFVERANAERQRLYETRTAQATASQLATANQRVAQLEQYQRENLLTPEQVGEAVRQDPFAFLNRHHIGLRELNERLESGGQQGQQPQVSSEVAVLQQKLEAQEQRLAQMQQHASQQRHVADRATAVSTLAQGLEQFKGNYPGLHALFGPQSGTSPAEQVMVGLERSMQIGSNMSADEVAGRLEREVQTHYQRLHPAYGNPPAAAPSNGHVPQTAPPTLAAQTAGITNATPSPTRVPRRPMSRAEEIAQAASLLVFK